MTHKGRSKSSYTDTVKHKICKSYFVTFQHSFLQLKCTWSGVSPKVRLHCRGMGVHSFLLFQPAICRADNGPHSKLSLCMDRSEPPSHTCPQSKQHLNRFSSICRAQNNDRSTVDTPTYRAIGRIYIVVRCGLISCAILKSQMVLTRDTISVKFVMSIYIGVTNFLNVPDTAFLPSSVGR